MPSLSSSRELVALPQGSLPPSHDRALLRASTLSFAHLIVPLTLANVIVNTSFSSGTAPVKSPSTGGESGGDKGCQGGGGFCHVEP